MDYSNYVHYINKIQSIFTGCPKILFLIIFKLPR